MYAGQIVEMGAARDVLERPAHPYTRRLIDCVPALGSGRRAFAAIGGAPPAANRLPSGCAFADRCDFADAGCRTGPVGLVAIAEQPRRALSSSPGGGVLNELALEARGLTKRYGGGYTLIGRPRPANHAVSNVAFSLSRGRNARDCRRIRMREIDPRANARGPYAALGGNGQHQRAGFRGRQDHDAAAP